MPTKKLLTGQDFCNCPPCEERSQSVWPETSIDQVQIDDSSSLNLKEWITNVNNTESEIKGSLSEWLRTYYPLTGYSLPTSSTTTKGGTKIDSAYFNIQDDTLKLNDTSLTWQLDPSFTSSVNIGTFQGLFANSTLPSITLPKPTVTLQVDSVNLTVKQFLGGILQDSYNLDMNLVANALASNSTFRESFPVYTASCGILKNGNDFQHAYIMPEGGTFSLEIGKNRITIPTVTYDRYGHINGVVTQQVNTYNKTDNYLTSGLGAYYFRIPKSWISAVNAETSTNVYIPLFKIIKSGNDSDFRVNQLFEIVSRLSYSYYGKYLLNFGDYNNQTYYANDLLTITTASKDFSFNIVAYYKNEIIDNNTVRVVTVYRQYSSIFNQNEDTFFVIPLGENNPYIESPQNNYIYYQTSDVNEDYLNVSKCVQITESNKDDYIITDSSSLGTQIV